MGYLCQHEELKSLYKYGFILLAIDQDNDKVIGCATGYDLDVCDDPKLNPIPCKKL